MATFDRDTGALVGGVDEMWQGVAVILETRKRTRVMRRQFGSRLPSYVDRPISPTTAIDWFAEIADALRAEPRFKLIYSRLSSDSNVEGGQAVFEVAGIYYPRGHLGDFSEAETLTKRIVLVSGSRQVSPRVAKWANGVVVQTVVTVDEPEINALVTETGSRLVTESGVPISIW